MIFTAKKKSFMMIFLFISMLPAGAVAKTDSQCIEVSLTKIEDLNSAQLKNFDEAAINKMINEKETWIKNLFQCIESGSEVPLKSTQFSDRLRFLKARISTNRSLNNTQAVQRDQLEIYTKQIRIRVADFLSLVNKVYNTRDGKNKIIERTKAERTYLENLTIADVEYHRSNKIAAELKEKNFEFKVLFATYSDILHFTMAHAASIIKERGFYSIQFDRVIDTINSFKPVQKINQIVLPMGLDTGRLALGITILILISLLYPLFSRVCDIIAAAIAKKTDIPHKVEIFYTALKRPLKLIVLFVGIDIALSIVFYTTSGIRYFTVATFSIYAVLCIYFVFKLIDSVAIVQAQTYENKQLKDEIINTLIKLFKFIVFVIGLSVVLNHFGVQMTAILSTLGIGGLALALAAKDSLSNLFGGITIFMDDIFSQGDYIKIQDVEGTVVEVGVRSTTVRTFANALVTVPNSTISNSHVMNWSKREVGRRIKMTIGVTYDSGIQDVKNAVKDIRDMLAEHPDIANPGTSEIGTPRKKRQAKFVSKNDAEGIMDTQMVYFDRYNDYSMDILIYCFSKTTNWAEWLKIKEELLYNIHEIVGNNNLEFAYPTEVHINTNQTNDA